MRKSGGEHHADSEKAATYCDQRLRLYKIASDDIVWTKCASEWELFELLSNPYKWVDENVYWGALAPHFVITFEDLYDPLPDTEIFIHGTFGTGYISVRIREARKARLMELRAQDASSTHEPPLDIFEDGRRVFAHHELGRDPHRIARFAYRCCLDPDWYCRYLTDLPQNGTVANRIQPRRFVLPGWEKSDDEKELGENRQSERSRLKFVYEGSESQFRGTNLPQSESIVCNITQGTALKSDPNIIETNSSVFKAYTRPTP